LCRAAFAKRIDYPREKHRQRNALRDVMSSSPYGPG
jgi:hypothetical protein